MFKIHPFSDTESCENQPTSVPKDLKILFWAVSGHLRAPQISSGRPVDNPTFPLGPFSIAKGVQKDLSSAPKSNKNRPCGGKVKSSEPFFVDFRCRRHSWTLLDTKNTVFHDFWWCFFGCSDHGLKTISVLFRDPANVPIVYVFIYYTACLGFSRSTGIPVNKYEESLKICTTERNLKIDPKMTWKVVPGPLFWPGTCTRKTPETKKLSKK